MRVVMALGHEKVKDSLLRLDLIRIGRVVDEAHPNDHVLALGVSCVSEEAHLFPRPANLTEDFVVFVLSNQRND